MAKQTEEERKRSLKIKQQKRKGKQAYTPLTEKQKKDAMLKLIKTLKDENYQTSGFGGNVGGTLKKIMDDKY